MSTETNKKIFIEKKRTTKDVINSTSDWFIEIKNLLKIYGKGEIAVHAVNNISLHVAKGEIVLIMGPSGAGKTTFVQLLAGLLTPTSGKIFISKIDIGQISNGKLTDFRLHNIGFVFQKPNLLSSLTALQNIEMVLNLAGIKGTKSRVQATALLEKLGLGHRLHYLPQKLSGGEQQRVAIARALANNPQMIIADEPTANLDSKNGQLIIKLLSTLAKENETTVIIVSHDSRIMSYADRVLWLEDGILRVYRDQNISSDPVCLVKLEQVEEVKTIIYNEKKYFFCSLECLEEFENNPEQYTREIKEN